MKNILFIVVLFYSVSVLGQPQSGNYFPPKVIPPTPTPAALGKYGEFPVNMASGTPEISIPIFEVKGRKLNLPISLSYHASGIKVDEYASWVGLGWSLNAGGLVTRSMVGLPDEGDLSYQGYFQWEDTIRNSYITGIDPQAKNLYLKNIVEGLYDAEPDLFFYNISGDAGRFIFSHDSARTFPYKPIKITSDFQNKKFEIIAVDGTTYRFGVSLNNDSAFETTVITNQGSQPIHEVSSWYLTEIISADYSDTIFFKYDSHNFGYGNTLHQALNYYYLFSDGDPPALSHHNGDIELEWGNYTSGLAVLGARKLKEINFSNGKVVFSSSMNRSDLPGDSRLDSIEIYSNDNLNVPFKRFNFHYSYFNAEVYGSWENDLPEFKKHRLRLDSISENENPPYKFDYTNIALPPINSFRQDYWGFFNDEKSNDNLIQKITFDGHLLGGAERAPKESVMKAGMLEFIHFPTGGYSQFIFNPHKFGSDVVGGLRIKQIRLNDGVTGHDIKIKNYEYNSGIIIPYNIRYGNVVNYSEGLYDPPINCEIYRYNAYRLLPGSYVALGTSGGSPVSYGCVTVREGEGGNYNGKSVYKYICDQDEIHYGNDPYNYIDHIDYYPENTLYYSISNEWKRGNLLEEDHYDNLDKIKKKIINTYSIQDNYLSTDIIGLKVAYRTIHPSCYFVDYTYYHTKYHYLHTHIYNKWMYLTHAETYDYNQNDTTKYLKVKTDYYYSNDNHVQITKKITIDSKNDTMTNNYKYPMDFSSSAMNGVIGLMEGRHIYNPVIEEQLWRNSNLISGRATGYDIFSGTMLLPKTVYLLETDKPLSKTEFAETTSNFTLDSRYKPKYHINYSALGNIIQFNKENDINTSYQWGYSNTLPIAEVKNASSDKVAYTSFKAYNEGSWNFTSGNIIHSSTAKTGDSYFTFSGTNVISRAMTPGNYVIEYWAKSAISVTGGTVTDISTSSPDANGWILYKKKVVIATNTTLSLSVGSTTSIDELRLYPVDAKMTTYTYAPLIGMTSQTDENNVTTYYEYDNQGRLIRALDQDKKVLKQYEYHYQNQ